MPTNYEHSKIYKIYSESANLTYYGSTCKPLVVRFAQHKRYPKDKCTSSKVLEYDDAKIELVEEYPCQSRKELEKREGYYQDTFDCVNRCVTGIGHKESALRWSRRNKDKRTAYRENNKDKIKIRKAERYKEDKARIQAWSREIITCECGVEIRRSGLARHKKSDKHKMCLDLGREVWEKSRKEDYERLKKIRDEAIANSPIIVCGCGVRLKIRNIKRHEKSTAHRQWLLTQ